MVRKKIYEMEKHQLAMEPLIRYMRKICITMNNLFDVPFSTIWNPRYDDEKNEAKMNTDNKTTLNYLGKLQVK